MIFLYLGISRQSISKWESDLSYPETEKLMRISELFCCSLDYLFKYAAEKDCKEQTSEETNICAKGFNAFAVIAIGLNAKGIISLGLLLQNLIL